MATGSPTENQSTAPGDSLGSGQIANAPADEPGPSAATEREKRQQRTGLRLLAIGALLIVIGLALVPLLGDGNQNGIGATIAFFGALPAVAGVGLLLAAWTSRRSRKGKSFA